jgi:sirohydrochlorin cobaltochelatase
MIAAMERRGLILYAHGARDPRWAEPFERVLKRIRERQPSLPVALAFLDYLEPTLMTSAQRLVGEGVEQIRVLPLFFGRGGHLREDLPRQMKAVREAIPSARFEITEAAGEADAVIEALAEFALSGIG